jgi:hypothetical protein
VCTSDLYWGIGESIGWDFFGMLSMSCVAAENPLSGTHVSHSLNVSARGAGCRDSDLAWIGDTLSAVVPWSFDAGHAADMTGCL